MNALVVLALLASATATERIAKGEAAMAALEYDEAADLFTEAAADPAATDDERLRASLLAGIANRIAGRDVDARMSFRYVLLHAPDTKLPEDTSPRVRSFYELVRQEIAAERAAGDPALVRPAPAALPAPAAPQTVTAAPAAGTGPRAHVDARPDDARGSRGAAAASHAVDAVRPADADVDAGLPLAPLVLAGAGGVAALGGVAAVTLGEVNVSNAAADGAKKAQWLLVGRVGLGVVAVGAAALAGGAVWLALE